MGLKQRNALRIERRNLKNGKEGDLLELSDKWDW